MIYQIIYLRGLTKMMHSLFMFLPTMFLMEKNQLDKFYSEDDKVNPLSEYGRSKLEGKTNNQKYE